MFAVLAVVAINGKEDDKFTAGSAETPAGMKPQPKANCCRSSSAQQQRLLRPSFVIPGDISFTTRKKAGD
jgi:hypothetical protein